jgi:hypothetical protein
MQALEIGIPRRSRYSHAIMHLIMYTATFSLCQKTESRTSPVGPLAASEKKKTSIAPNKIIVNRFSWTIS